MAPATYYLERKIIVLGIAGRSRGAKGASIRHLRGRIGYGGCSGDDGLDGPVDGPQHELLECQRRLLERSVLCLDGLNADHHVRHLAIVDVIRCLCCRLPRGVEVIDAVDDRLAGVGPFAQLGALGYVLGQPEFQLDALLVEGAGPAGRGGRGSGAGW